MYDAIMIGARSLVVRDEAMSTLNLRSVFIGILATITMDVLSAAAYKLRLIAPLPPHLIGRWVACAFQGRLFHRDIGQVSPIKREMMIAASAHYGIGVTLALAYLFASSALGLAPRDPITALGFALCTNLLPWLLMFPAMGYGWFGTYAPAGTRLFRGSLVTHCFYGVGLCFGASILG